MIPKGRFIKYNNNLCCNIGNIQHVTQKVNAEMSLLYLINTLLGSRAHCSLPVLVLLSIGGTGWLKSAIIVWVWMILCVPVDCENVCVRLTRGAVC